MGLDAMRCNRLAPLGFKGLTCCYKLQKLRWRHTGVVQSLTAKFLAVTQNIWRLEGLWNLDNILSVLSGCHCSDCSDGRRCAWHAWHMAGVGSGSGRSRQRQSWSHLIMTRHRVEIARHCVTGSVKVTRVTCKLRCGRMTATAGNVLWLVVDEVGPTAIGWKLSITWCDTRRYVNCITEMKSISAAADGRQ